MPMKVLGLAGSARRGGNTETLLDWCLGAARDAGAVVVKYSLCDLDLHGCRACDACRHTGVCIQKDDMELLYPHLRTVDSIVIASPIYFYGVTAQAKALIDRAQALWSRKYILQKKGEWRENTDRLGFFVSVAATKGEKVFDGAVLTVKYFYDAIGFGYGGALLVKGIDKRGEMAKDGDKLSQAEEFGRRIVS